MAKQTTRRAAAARNKTGLAPGPNPAASKGLRVSPFANIFALVDGLGVTTLHRTEADAKKALEAELERRRALRDVKPASRPLATDEAHEPEPNP